MTLYLEAISFNESSMFTTSELVLIVQGSQCGQLKSPVLKSKQWVPPFKITCSSTDQLVFRGFPQGKYDQGSIVGQAKFHAASFIKKKSSQLSLEKPYEFEIALEKDQKQKGVVRLLIMYDKAKKYEGELAALNNIHLGQSKRKNIQFFKGKCPTTNLFSIWDSRAQGQQRNWIENTYRDK